MKFGTGKIGSSAKKKYFKLEKGETVYRILPPFGPMADTDTWAVFYKVHYGYKGLPNPKTGKAYMRVFLSPEVKNYKTGMIDVADPANERIRNLKEALAAAQKRGDKAASGELVNLLKTYNLDSKWHVNAVNLQGEIGMLKIPHKAYKSLEAEITRLRQEGVDPLSVENGRYFSFKRSGEGLETQYSVSVYKQKIEVPGLGVVEKDVAHVLSPDLIAKLGTVVNPQTGEMVFDREGHNLLVQYARPTAEQVARMVNEGAKAVEEILGQSGQEEEDDSSDVDSALSGASQSKETLTPTAPLASTPTPAATQAAPATPVQQTVGGLKIGGGTTSTPAVASVASSGTTVSPEEFLKSLGMGVN
jgi:hypothetical protein